jgi:predicted GH43/DUF377 family glycosyl hydrolase
MSTQRAGGVPNVVYTRGAMRLGDQVIIPYGVSDTFTRFATVEISDLIGSLVG